MTKMQAIFLIFLLWKYQYILARPQFNIGIILESENSESEIAFRTAVERANVHERNFELLPIVKYTNMEDSFVMEKTVCDLITQDVIAIFGPDTASSAADIVASICNTHDIPHLMYDWSASESLADRQHSTMTLNLHPDNLLFARGIAEIVQSFGWRSFTMIFETEKELQQLQDVLQINEPGSNPTTVRQLGTDSDYRPFLKNIKISSDNCIILFCKSDKISSILHQANELKMLGEYQSFFIPMLDTHTVDLTEFLTAGANITTIRLLDPTDFHVKNIVHDWEELENREGRYYKVEANQIKTKMALLNDAIWVLAKGLAELGIAEELVPPNVDCRKNRAWPTGRRIIEFIKARNEEGATGRIDFNEFGKRSFFTLRFMELDATGFIDLATWNPVNGVDILADDESSDKRVGEKLANKTFIITSRIGAPFLLNRETKEGETLQGNARYEGYSMDLIDAIAKLLNFKYEFVLAPDGKYGSFNKQTQSWDGLVKQLLDGNMTRNYFKIYYVKNIM